MSALLKCRRFLRLLCSVLKLDTGGSSEEAQRALEMLTLVVTHNDEAYYLALQAVMGLPFKLPQSMRFVSVCKHI